MLFRSLPALSVLDNFNRANANTLGSNWSQSTLFGNASIRINSNRAYALLSGYAVWNNPSAGFGNKQGAAFTFANAPSNSLGTLPSLILKATNGTTNLPRNFIRVSYQNTTNLVTVSTTTNSGAAMTLRAAFNVTLATNDTLSAVAYNDGTVRLYKNGTFIGSVTIPTSGADAWTQGSGGGRIGIQLPLGQRVDDFRGGTLP